MPEHIRRGARKTARGTEAMHQRNFRVVVGVETIEGDDDRALKLRGAVEMSGEIFQPALQCIRVRQRERIERHAAVHLQRTDGRDDHNRRGSEPALAALDVHEFLPAEIKGESGLRDCEIGMRERHARREHGVAAVRDVCKRSAMHEGGHSFDALHEIRHQRLAEQRHHRAGDAEFLREDRLALWREADDDAIEPLA